MDDGVALELEIAADDVRENERAKVADVGEVMHGRPAAIHGHFLALRVEGDKLLKGARECVEQFEGHAPNARRSLMGFGGKKSAN
jgi:hypothetical protein